MDAIIQEGIVTNVTEQTAQVKVLKRGFCTKGHTVCPMSPTEQGGVYIITVAKTADVTVGDRVRINVIMPHYYWGITVVFICPVLALLLGYGCGVLVAHFLGIDQTVCGYTGMGIGFVLSIVAIMIFGNRFDTTYSMDSKLVKSKAIECNGC